MAGGGGSQLALVALIEALPVAGELGLPWRARGGWEGGLMHSHGRDGKEVACMRMGEGR